MGTEDQDNQGMSFVDGSTSEPAPGDEQMSMADKDSGAIPGVASRQTQSSTTQTVLNSGYELREIVVAQGIEHHNSDPWLYPKSSMQPYGYQVPRGLQTYLPDNADHEWESISDNAAVFVSHAQRVRYSVRVINTKNEYKRALETAGLHVIYMGHSRYGRGQCFGATADPGERWEQGSGDADGLLRSGYGVIGVHFTDIDEHGYNIYPVAASVTLRPGWLHPEISRGGLHRVHLSPELQSRLLPVAQPAEDWYWASHDSEGPTLLLWGGWTQTISDPYDLGAANLQCRCTCYFSCSTRTHFWSILRERKNWRRTADDRFAYFTTSVSYPLTAWAWLRAVFEYPKRNDYQSWYPSLEWAKRRCGQILAGQGEHYGIY
ncbi:MAG TPA: hypothetical protein VGM03_13400 [Phycisphaerae bacterium]|jgi:hypothetical protein